jgi:PAS domain S-box-containing protein
MSSSERLERLLHELTYVQTHLQEFFEIPSDLFAVLKPNGIFWLVSPAWETVLGWSPPLLQTHCWTEFLHPLDVSSSHYHLQVLQNLSTGAHPERNQQFEKIEQLIETYQAAGHPVISMDTKKKN